MELLISRQLCQVHVRFLKPFVGENSENANAVLFVSEMASVPDPDFNSATDCWNCHNSAAAAPHTYGNCPVQRMRRYCFSCGAENYDRATCVVPSCEAAYNNESGAKEAISVLNPESPPWLPRDTPPPSPQFNHSESTMDYSSSG